MMRFEFDGRVDERNGQQFVSGRAAYGDGWTNIHRIEPHGFASMPVKGAKGLILPSQYDPELAFVLGLESPGNRPKDLPSGGVAIYDSTGNIMKLIGDGIVVDVADRTITTTAGDWVLNGPATINGDLTVNGNINCSGSVVDGDGNNGA